MAAWLGNHKTLFPKKQQLPSVRFPRPPKSPVPFSAPASSSSSGLSHFSAYASLFLSFLRLRTLFLPATMIIRQGIARQSHLLGSSISTRSVRCFSSTPITVQQVQPTDNSGGSNHSAPPSYDSLTAVDRARRRDHEEFKHFKATTATLGTALHKHYQPHRLVNSPPSPKDITLALLLASQAHLGHATSLWNPANQRYIFGVRQGIHIISLEIIAAQLRRAAKIVEGVTERGGVVLFVGTRPGQERCVVNAAKLAGGYHLFERWTPGAITNAAQILGHGKVVEMDMRDRRREDKANKTKSEGKAPPKTIKPDLVICLNPLENYVLLHECGSHAIPTIGIIDTDADPSWVTYPIPANDDSLRCVQLIAGILGRAGEDGRNRRLRRAEREEYEQSQRQAEDEKAAAGIYNQQEQDDIDTLFDDMEAPVDEFENQENRRRNHRTESRL